MYTVVTEQQSITFHGDRLRKLRKKEGLSQGALAEILNVNQQEISDWELGLIPETKNILKIIIHFKVRPDYLFGVAENWELETAVPTSPPFVDELADAVTEHDLDKLDEIVARLRQLKNK